MSEEAMPEALEPELKLAVGHDGRTLEMSVVQGVVVAASISGTVNDVEKEEASAVCSAMTGITLREAVEHSAIYATRELIDSGRLCPPAGIALPSALGADMERIQVLLGKVRDIPVVSGLPIWDGWNFEDRGLSQRWREEDRNVKIAEIRTQLADFLCARGEPLESIVVTDIDRYDRINVHFSEIVPINKKPKMIREFERFIREQTGERLEVFVSEMKDLSRIRRL